MRPHAVTIVGATGLVGRKMLQVLEERGFPVRRLVLLASERSEGKELVFQGESVRVQRLRADTFHGAEIVLCAAGAAVSVEYAPHAIRHGALMIDNSSAFRLQDGIPLVVPEVNRSMIFRHHGLIANPNCSTIQLVVAVKPIHDRWKVKRIVVATYQAVTGAGQRGVSQLQQELARLPVGQAKFPHAIAHNVLPQVDVFLSDGYTREEHKMMRETLKIMGDESLKVTATCTRVPVWNGHSEAVNVELERPFELAEVRAALSGAPGIAVVDDPGSHAYPMPINTQDRDEVFVGRLRRDETVANGLNMWVVADNLRKGAATNAVQIAEEWIKGE